MIVVPLIPIELQLLEDCRRLGLTALAGSQVWKAFKALPFFPNSHLKKIILSWSKLAMCDIEEKLAERPKILVCNVEFLAARKVVWHDLSCNT